MEPDRADFGYFSNCPEVSFLKENDLIESLTGTSPFLPILSLFLAISNQILDIFSTPRAAFQQDRLVRYGPFSDRRVPTFLPSRKRVSIFPDAKPGRYQSENRGFRAHSFVALERLAGEICLRGDQSCGRLLFEDIWLR